jgi:hypothetical protein
VTQRSEERLAISERKICTKKNLWSSLWKKLVMETKHNDELCELLNGPYVVKYINLKTLKLPGLIIRMDVTFFFQWLDSPLGA